MRISDGGRRGYGWGDADQARGRCAAETPAGARLELGEARGSGGCQNESGPAHVRRRQTDTCTDSPDTGQTPSPPANLRLFRTAAVCEHYLASSSMLP